MQTTSATRAGCERPALFRSTGTRAAIETDNRAIGCQRIETQNSADITGTESILSADATPIRRKKTGLKGNARTGLVPRRKRAVVMREIPLSMLPAAIRRGVKEKGGKLYRIVIVRSHWNHYIVKCRCNTKKAMGCRSALRRKDQTLNAYGAGEVEDDG